MPKNILIIDDEELVTKSLCRLLKKQGYEVVVAESGQEAIQRVKEADFDLIISDVRMPDVDGIDAIRDIREYLKQEKKQLISEILITGYASKESYDRAKELNVADYIYKPFDTKVFLDTVKRNLRD